MNRTPRLEIEYCTQCRWLLRAAWLAQELLTTFVDELGEVALVPGKGGLRGAAGRRDGVVAQGGGPLPGGEGGQAAPPRPRRPRP